MRWRTAEESRRAAEQFETGAVIHLPLEGFQPVDVTFHPASALKFAGLE
jgi:hypothetical protein